MPECPHCGRSGKIIEFLYRNIWDGSEGFNVDHEVGDNVSYYLVCPDCDAILGGHDSQGPDV